MRAVSTQRFLERDSELSRLEAALAVAAGGRGQLVVVEAAAGLGKTTLLDAAVERARDRGLVALRARGSTLESNFAFGVVRQLLEPALARAGREDLQALFAGAAALAKPLFESVPEDVSQSPDDGAYRTLHGLYWLLSNLAATGPLVLAVDDVHWADAPSLRFLAFLYTRLVELPIALVVSVRSGEPAGERAPLALLAGAPEAVVLRPAPLSTTAVHELVRRALGDDPDADLVTACHDVTAGNPFYLHVLLAELSSQVSQARTGLAERVRHLGPRAVSRSVLLRVATLGPTAPALTRAVAVLGDAAALGEAAALAQLEEGAAAAAADLLMKAGVMKTGRGLEFVHPIVREAVYGDLGPRERAAEHARAADVLAAAGARPERIAAQLLHSAPAGDIATVELLWRAARHASSRGAPETAITFLRRALDEPPPEELRPALLAQLGTAEFHDGRMEAAEHLQAVLASGASPALRADAALQLARALAFAQRPHEAIATLQGVLDTLGSDDRERALELEAELIATAQLDVLPGEVVAERFRRLRLDDVRQPRTLGESQLLAVFAFQALRENQAATIVIELGRQALAGPDGSPLPFSLPASLAALALAYAGDNSSVTEWLDHVVAGARARAAVSEFAAASLLLADVARGKGDLRQAEAHVQAAVEALDNPAAAGLLAGVQAGVLLDRGDVAAATAVLERTGMIDAPADQVPLSEALYSRGHLRRAQGDHAGALRDLLACGERLVSTGSRSPAPMAWRSSRTRAAGARRAR